MKNIRLFRIILLGFLLFLSFLVFVSKSEAYEFEGGDKIVVESGEVIEDDLYVGANYVEIKGTIKGDLVVFGTEISISPEAVIEGDLLAAGQTIKISGKIKDDVRLGGFLIELGEGGSVDDDFLGAGYSIQIEKGSQVGGDLVVWGFQAMINDDIAGDLTANVNSLELNSIIGGNAEIEVGEQSDVVPVTPFRYMLNMPSIETIPGGLTIGQNARIEGNLTYTAPQEEKIPSWAVSGEVIYKQQSITAEARTSKTEKSTAEKTGIWLLRLIQRYISILLVGLLIIWLVPDFLEQSAVRLQVKYWMSLGMGAIVYFGFYFLILFALIVAILIAVVFGILKLPALSFLTFGTGITLIFNLVITFIFSVAFFSKIVVAYLGGRLILERYKSEWSLKMFWPFILGGLLVVLLIMLPYVGWVFNLLITFLGLGAAFLLAKDRIIHREDTTIGLKGKR